MVKIVFVVLSNAINCQDNSTIIFYIFQPSPACSNPEVASSTAESLEQQRIWLWQQFATHVTPSVQRVVEFAKRVPGTSRIVMKIIH